MYLVKVATANLETFFTEKMVFTGLLTGQNIITGRFDFVIVAQMTNPAQIKIHIWRFFTNGTESSVR